MLVGLHRQQLNSRSNSSTSSHTTEKSRRTASLPHLSARVVLLAALITLTALLVSTAESKRVSIKDFNSESICRAFPRSRYCMGAFAGKRSAVSDDMMSLNEDHLRHTPHHQLRPSDRVNPIIDPRNIDENPWSSSASEASKRGKQRAAQSSEDDSVATDEFSTTDSDEQDTAMLVAALAARRVEQLNRRIRQRNLLRLIIDELANDAADKESHSEKSLKSSSSSERHSRDDLNSNNDLN